MRQNEELQTVYHILEKELILDKKPYPGQERRHICHKVTGTFLVNHNIIFRQDRDRASYLTSAS